MVQPFPSLDGYDAVLTNYWSAVRNQLDRHVISSGPIKRVFVETVTGRGEDALVQLNQANPHAHSLVRYLVGNGATVEEFEDAELLSQLIDWGQCASQNLVSEKVGSIVASGQAETAGQRDEHLMKRLNDAIDDDESALVLAISEQLPVPDRVERFIVSPPELDQLERWLRAKMEEARREMIERAQRESQQQSAETGAGSQAASSGLWTPP